MITTSRTALVSNSTQPTHSDGTTTTSVIIVVAVVIILVIIVVGVVILVVLFRAKKRKQQLEINKLQKAPTEKENIEMKLKHERTTKLEASPSPYQPQYSEIDNSVIKTYVKLKKSSNHAADFTHETAKL